MPIKSASIILSFFILFQSFNVHLMDVLNLNKLFEHMQFHEDAYGDDVFSFLSKHYGQEMKAHHEQNNGEEKDHQKLPFNQRICMDGGQLFIIERFVSKLPVAHSPSVNNGAFYYNNIYSFMENIDIFQPPRVA